MLANAPALDLERLRTMLNASLAMWDIHGAVAVSEPPTVAIILTADGRIASVEASCDPDTPFRWIVSWSEANGAADASPPRQFQRGCASVVGVLSALRAAFSVQPGGPVRIASIESP